MWRHEQALQPLGGVERFERLKLPWARWLRVEEYRQEPCQSGM
jgi:hypothetical protein